MDLPSLLKIGICQVVKLASSLAKRISWKDIVDEGLASFNLCDHFIVFEAVEVKAWPESVLFSMRKDAKLALFWSTIDQRGREQMIPSFLRSFLLHGHHESVEGRILIDHVLTPWLDVLAKRATTPEACVVLDDTQFERLLFVVSFLSLAEEKRLVVSPG